MEAEEGVLAGKAEEEAWGEQPRCTAERKPWRAGALSEPRMPSPRGHFAAREGWGPGNQAMH